MTHRRPLPLLLAAGLLTGGLVATASPAVADPDPEPATQDLVLVDTATARSVTGSWTATPTTTMYGTLEVLITSGATRCTQTGATITFAYAGEDACTVTVQALGDSTHAPSNTVSVTFDVAGHPTTTTLEPVPADPDEHVVGDEIDLVATVSSAGHGAPDGTLTIVALGPDDTVTTDDTVVGTSDQALDPVTGHPDRGTATAQVTPDDAETTDYAARYTPATPSVFAASTGTYSLSSLWPTQTTLVPEPADPDEHVVGDEIDLVATVSTTGHGAPDGTLTIVALGPDDTVTTDDTVVGTPDQTLTAVTGHPDRGTAQVQVTPDDAETTAYEARYTPATPSTFAPSTGAYSLTTRWPTETTLTTDPVPSATAPKVGHPVVLEAEVTSDGHGDPTGTVRFVALGPDDTITSDDELVDTAQTLAPKAGSSDTRTASVTFRPEGVAEVEYAARYVPTSATHVRSTSAPVAVEAVLRDVDVTIDVDPVVDAGDTAEVTVTVIDLDPSDLDIAPFAVAPGAGTTVTVDDEIVDPADIDWTDDVTFTVPTSGAALHEIEVAFVPADGDTYATPAVELASFRSKLTQTPTVVPDEAAPYLAGGLVTPKFTGAHGTRTYTPLTTGICTMESGKVRLVKAGACEVDVDLAGDDTYKPGEAQLSFTVEPRPVTVTVTAAPQTTKYGPGILISAVAKDGSTVLAGTGKITISRAEGSTAADGLTPSLDYDYSGSPVSFVPPRFGTYEITVSFTPTPTLKDIVHTSEGDAEVVVERADETVTITAPEPTDPDFEPYVGYVWTDVADSSVVGHTPVITATDTDPDVVVCEVGDDLASVVLLAPGDCDVHAYVLQDDRYVGDVDDLRVTVHPRPVTVAVTEVTTPDDDAYDDADDLPRYGEKVVVEVTATDTISGTEPVSGPGVIAVRRPDGTTLHTETVTFVDGVAEIDAVPDALDEHDVVVTLAPDQVHDADADQDIDRYETITTPRTAGTLDVQKGRQRITLDVAAPDPAYVDEDWTIEATGGGSDLEIEASSTSAACAVDGLVVTFRAAATRSCVIDLHQDGDEEFYEPGDAQVTVEVSPRPVTVEVTWPTTDPARVLRYRTPFKVVVTARDDLTGDPVAGPGEGELTLGTQTADLDFVAGVATLTTFTPTQVGVGLDVSATFEATRGHAYAAVPDPAGEKITIAMATQAIRYTAPDASYNVDDVWDPEAEGGDSGEPVELTIVDEDGDPLVSEVCQVVDGDTSTPALDPVVLFLEVGSCRVALDQDGDDELYEPAPRRYADTGVVLLAVTLDVTAPPTTTTYATEAALEVASTSTRHVGTVAPGTLGVRVVDVTSGCAVYDDLPALADAPPTAPDWSGAPDCAMVLAPELDASVSGGTLTVTFAAQTLLEGDYHVTVGYDGGPASEYAATRTTTTFHVKPGEQTLDAAQTSYTGYASTEVSPDFQRSRSAAVLTLGVSDLSHLASLDDYARAEAAAIARGTTYTRPTAPCTVLDDDIRLVAKGTCVVTAMLEGVTRKWADSDPVSITTEVSRIPVTLTVTRSAAPAVGKEARLTAQASYLHPVTELKSAPVGSGPLTVTGVGGDTRTDQAWLGGGRSYAFVPEHAAGYGYVADFLPFHPETFASARVTGTITPGKGTQVLGGYDVSALPTTAKVGQADWRPTGTGGRFGNVVRVKVVDGTGVCSVVPAVPAVATDPLADALSFDGAGTCGYRLFLDANPDWNDVTSERYEIEVSQTEADLALDVPTLTYDTDATVTATATVAGDPSSFVPGEGTVTVMVDGDEVDSVTTENSDAGMTLVFRPGHVTADVSFSVDFEPDDAAAYAIDAERTVTTGVQPRTQTVALAAHDGSAWAGDTWDTAVTASGAPGAVPVVTGTCEPDDDGIVTFRTAGPCRVTADLPAVDENDDGVDEWVAAHAERTIGVELNATRIVLTVDEERVLNEDIAVSAQVSGRRGDDGVWGGVSGTVQFHVDTGAFGEPVDVDAGGFASAVVQAAPDLDNPRWAQDWEDGDVPTHAFWATFTPDPVEDDEIQLWTGSTSPTQDLAVARRTQTLSNEASPPPELPVGAVWIPQPTSTSDLDVDTVPVDEGSDDGACSVTGNRVTILQASTTSTSLACMVSYVQAGNAEWAPVTEGGPTHTVLTTARETTLALTPVPSATGTDAAVASPFVVTATVGLVGHELDPTTRPAVPDLSLEGTVTFTVGDTTYERVLDPATGTATLRLDPDTAEALDVTATFAPDREEILAPSDDTAVYSVAQAPSTTSQPSISAAAITTSVRPVEGREARSAPSGTVTFTYVVGGTSYPLETVDLVGRVATTSILPPARLRATVVATYDGDRDHLTSTAQRLRDVPTVTPTIAGSTTGWNTGTVRITFRCDPTTAALVTECPAAVTLSRDGADQTLTRTVRAADGGTTVVVTDPVDIDRNGPSVTIAGTADGAWYPGSAPAAACRARDAVSGIASCVVTRSKTGARTFTDTAVAVDGAGNRSTVRAAFEVRGEWIAGAPLAGGSFQVKPGAKVRVVTRTRGDQPQLMVPVSGGGGKMKASSLFTASQIDDGIITWSATLQLPKGIGVGKTYTVGYRVTGAGAITKLTMKVVRKPQGRQARRGR